MPTFRDNPYGAFNFIVTLGGFLVWRGLIFRTGGKQGQTLAPLAHNFQLLGGGPNGALGEWRSWVLAASKAMQDENLCDKVKVSGLGLPSEMLSYTMNDCAPQFALWNVAGHAFNVHWGSAESYVAVVILEGLARQLGHVSQRPVVFAAHLDRDALADLVRPLAYESSENLRSAARLLWIELYGEPLLPIVDVPASGSLATL